MLGGNFFRSRLGRCFFYSIHVSSLSTNTPPVNWHSHGFYPPFLQGDSSRDLFGDLWKHGPFKGCWCLSCHHLVIHLIGPPVRRWSLCTRPILFGRRWSPPWCNIGGDLLKLPAFLAWKENGKKKRRNHQIFAFFIGSLLALLFFSAGFFSSGFFHVDKPPGIRQKSLYQPILAAWETRKTNPFFEWMEIAKFTHVSLPWASTTIKIMVDPISMIKTLR